VENGVERAENWVQRSGEQGLQKNNGAERSVEREVAEWEWRGSGVYRNRLERGAAFSLLTLRSVSAFRINNIKIKVNVDLYSASL